MNEIGVHQFSVPTNIINHSMSAIKNNWKYPMPVFGNKCYNLGQVTQDLGNSLAWKTQIESVDIILLVGVQLVPFLRRCHRDFI